MTQRWSWHWNKRHIHFNCVGPQASAAVASWLSAATCLSDEEHVRSGLKVDLQNVLSNARGL